MKKILILFMLCIMNLNFSGCEWLNKLLGLEKEKTKQEEVAKTENKPKQEEEEEEKEEEKKPEEPEEKLISRERLDGTNVYKEEWTSYYLWSGGFWINSTGKIMPVFNKTGQSMLTASRIVEYYYIVEHPSTQEQIKLYPKLPAEEGWKVYPFDDWPHTTMEWKSYISSQISLVIFKLKPKTWATIYLKINKY
jgi:hypothetical protein